MPTLRPGERLPPDTDLCRELGVSRMTARNVGDGVGRDGGGHDSGPVPGPEAGS